MQISATHILPKRNHFSLFTAFSPFPFETVIPNCSTNSISRAYPIPLVPRQGAQSSDLHPDRHSEGLHYPYCLRKPMHVTQYWLKQSKNKDKDRVDINNIPKTLIRIQLSDFWWMAAWEGCEKPKPRWRGVGLFSKQGKPKALFNLFLSVSCEKMKDNVNRDKNSSISSPCGGSWV